MNTNTFIRRPLSSPATDFVNLIVKPRLRRAALRLAYYLTVWLLVTIAMLCAYHYLSYLFNNKKAEAAEIHGFTFADKLPSFQIQLPTKQTNGYWQLPGGTAQQNEVLKKCQDGLRARGISDTGVIRYGCGILVSENESLDPLRLGDQGHAFGICQRNLGRVYARDFLARHPEWKTIDVQLAYCNDRFAAAYKRYGNIFQATVEHNCPACAARKQDARHIQPSYFQRVRIATDKLALL